MFANIRIPDITAALLKLLQAVHCTFQQTEHTGVVGGCCGTGSKRVHHLNVSDYLNNHF